FSAVEVQVVMALLRLLDNPLQDIPLAAVLRSPIVGLDERDLAEIRARQPRGPFHAAVRAFAENESELASRVRAFLAQLDAWRTKARSEEHPSELQSRENLICRLLLDIKRGKDHKLSHVTSP